MNGWTRERRWYACPTCLASIEMLNAPRFGPLRCDDATHPPMRGPITRATLDAEIVRREREQTAATITTLSRQLATARRALDAARALRDVLTPADAETIARDYERLERELGVPVSRAPLVGCAVCSRAWRPDAPPEHDEACEFAALDRAIAALDGGGGAREDRDG